LSRRSIHAAPFSSRSGPLGNDVCVITECVDDKPYGGWTDFGQRALDLTTPEHDRGLPEDVAANAVLLTALRLTGSGHALFEVLVGVGGCLGQVGRPGPDGVVAIVPVALGLVEPVVVRIPGLEDPLLDADVAGDAIPLRQQLVGTKR
jgi:hypothetical protein